MAGRPNFPKDDDTRHDLKGSAVGTPGLTALDEEREASLADEGGASGAYVETQDADEIHRIESDLPLSHLQVVEGDRPLGWGQGLALIAGAAAAGALVGLAFRRR